MMMINFDSFYLPDHFTNKHKELILESAKKALYYGMTEFVQGSYGFSNTEIQKIKRLYDYAIHEDDFDVEKNRKDFVKFVDELDKRRDTNFVKTFPETGVFCGVEAVSSVATGASFTAVTTILNEPSTAFVPSETV